MDEIALKLLRNNNYSDEVVILNHWKNIIESICRSNNHNKLELVKAKIIALAKDFYDSCSTLLPFLVDSPVFFPLPYLFEIVLSAGVKECHNAMTLHAWFIHCFTECGVSYEEIAKTLSQIMNLKPTSQWEVMVSGLFVA